MKNTTWRKRRLKKGLDISEVANYLDISYERYALIDKGDVKMPNKYIEKFNELINKSKGETNVNRLTREETVNVWWSKMCKKEGRGKFGLDEKLKEFNIANLSELDKLMGYSSPGATSNYLNRGETLSYDLKNKYFSFFENELNIQPPKTKKTKVFTNRIKGAVCYNGDEEYAKLLAWFNTMDFKQWALEKGLSRESFRDQSGLSDGSVSNIYSKKYKTPYKNTLKRLKQFVNMYDEIMDTKPVAQTMVFTSVPVEEVPEDLRMMGRELVREVNENMTLKERLTSKYESILHDINIEGRSLQRRLDELSKEKEIYEKLLEDINED